MRQSKHRTFAHASHSPNIKTLELNSTSSTRDTNVLSVATKTQEYGWEKRKQAAKLKRNHYAYNLHYTVLASVR